MWKHLRKFGLQHCDLPTMLSNVGFVLRPLTVNIDSRHTKPIPLVFYFLLPIFATIYTYTYFLSMIWFVFWHCIETGDMVAAMIIFPLGITSEIGVTKFIYVYIYKNKIRKLLEEYLICDSMVGPDSRFSQNLTKALRNVKKRAIIYWLIININGMLYILKPLLTPGRTSMEDIFILYGLDPPLETPNYEISYLMMTAGCCFTCYLTSNVAVFLIVIIGYIEAQLLVLSQELLNLYNDSVHQFIGFSENNLTIVDVSTKYDTEEETEESYKAINEILAKNLRKIVRMHTMNINLLCQVKAIFKGAFAVEFLVLSVGLIAELLGGLQNTYMEVPFAIIQVAMDCLVGQRLMDACNSFESAVYSCKWERYNASNMKTVLLMLMNSQKTMTLSIGDIAILNFECLMSVFRSIYSAFTTLQSVL